MSPLTERFELRLDEDTIARVDRWRFARGGSRAEAIRQLVQFALEVQANESYKLYRSAGDAVNTNNIKSDPTHWITIRQVKAARTLVGWSQLDLANHSSLSQPTIARLESAEGRLAGRRETIRKIRAALESAGVEFTNGDQPGVRLRKSAEVHAGESTNEPKPTPLGRSRRGARK